MDRRIVIADDHPVIRLGVRMALMRGGFRVVGRSGRREGAVNAVMRERPDVCLSTCACPAGVSRPLR